VAQRGEQAVHRTTILDRVDEIKKTDKSGMLTHCLKTAEYCQDVISHAEKVEIPEEVRVSKRIVEYRKPRNIVIAGMGGSAIGGEILRDWLRDEISIPIDVCSEYALPAYTDEHTLVFAVSYSGETEETLNAFADAILRNCMVIAITSGGHLLSFAKELQLPHVMIPAGLPPRAALPYVFFPLPVLMKKIGVLSDKRNEIEESMHVIKMVSEENSPQIPTENNVSKKLALQLKDSVPVVYGFRQYGAVAHRLKTQFNENSKVPSRYEVFPELNHNEVVGWEASEDLTKMFSVLLIRDHNEPDEIKNRIEATKSTALLKAERILEIYAKGEEKLAKMFSIITLGDFTSVYLAILKGVDPVPVKTIDEIKMAMKKKFNAIEKVEKEIQKIV
jgi:glucose/mannose-6-phosphate isomerase